jgi:hypothetical protein
MSTFSRTSFKILIFTLHLTARIEKPSNGTSAVTPNSRFVAAAPLTITPYHIPRGTVILLPLVFIYFFGLENFEFQITLFQAPLL